MVMEQSIFGSTALAREHWNIKSSKIDYKDIKKVLDLVIV